MTHGGSQNNDIDYGEGLEVCQKGELGDDKKPAFPVFAYPAAASAKPVEQEPVAWRYEWASCITTAGPQDFRLKFEVEPPPAWAVADGQARNVVALYASPQAPVAAVQWQPIDTMPRDTDVLVRGHGGYAVAYKGTHGVIEPSGVYATYDGAGGVAFQIGTLTHWQLIADA